VGDNGEDKGKSQDVHVIAVHERHSNAWVSFHYVVQLIAFASRAISLDLGGGVRAGDSVAEALLRLLEVDDVPDGVKVLEYGVLVEDTDRGRGEAYVRANVEVLEVVGVLPDIDADDWNVGEERVLVRGSSNLELLGRRIKALQ
jgi:hypothetical protein